MIRDDIKTALVTAMKGGDKAATGTIRLIQSAIKNRDIELRTGTPPADDDLLVTEVLQKMIKQRRESADLYRKGNREELAATEEAEILVIERFLPKQMTRRRGLGCDPGDHRRDWGGGHEGHGQGHGRGEIPPRRADRSRPRQRNGPRRARLTQKRPRRFLTAEPLHQFGTLSGCGCSAFRFAAGEPGQARHDQLEEHDHQRHGR